MADDWVCPPLIVGDALCGPGVKEANALITLCKFPSVGLE
jgi:hypothetical protein